MTEMRLGVIMGLVWYDVAIYIYSIYRIYCTWRCCGYGGITMLCVIAGMRAQTPVWSVWASVWRVKYKYLDSRKVRSRVQEAPAWWRWWWWSLRTPPCNWVVLCGNFCRACWCYPIYAATNDGLMERSLSIRHSHAQHKKKWENERETIALLTFILGSVKYL